MSGTKIAQNTLNYCHFKTQFRKELSRFEIKGREMDTNATGRLKDLAISESGFLFDPYSGSTFTLNSTGRFILQLLMEGKEIEDIESALRKKFEVGDEDLRSDIYEFVNLLKENHFLPNSFAP
jgi:hypothetical protein